ncbi:MAG: alpha/beta hydrolase [Candidatus Marithrix sp.]
MKIFTLLFILLILSVEIKSQTRYDSVLIESEIVLKTSTGDIYGVLTIAKNSEITPIVLIIAGSGPTDRDGNSPYGLQTNAYKMLAEGFAEKGISCLRYDKRGISKSKLAMISESELRLETYIKDVSDWINLLKSDNRFSDIYILGHSEGSLIGMVAASSDSSLSGFISISGVAKSADKILLEQLDGKLPPNLIDESIRILDSLKLGKTVSKVNSSLMAIFRPSVQPYMISWFKYDPAIEIAKLKMPVCIIQGTTDLQVNVDEAKALSVAKPDATLIIIQNMNHVLKESDSNPQENMATYNKPSLPLKSELIEKLVSFIMENK